MPMALHGCESSLINGKLQKQFTTSITDTISNHTIHKDTNTTFTTSSHGPDADPETHIFHQRLNTLRRFTAKRHTIDQLARGNLNLYIANGYTGTDTKIIHDGAALPAPLPGNPQRAD